MRRDAGLLASPSDKERSSDGFSLADASPVPALRPPVSASVRAIGKAGLSGQISAFGRAPPLVVAKVTLCSSLCGVAHLYCREVSNGKQWEIVNCLLRVK